MKKKQIEHYFNGKLQGIGSEYSYVRSDGVWEEVFDDITLSRVNFLNGARHGLSEVFDGEGSICERTYYKNGLKDGVHEKYEKNKIIVRENYKDGYRHGLCEKFNTNESSTDKNISTSITFHKGLPFDLNKLIKEYFNDLNVSVGINNLKDVDDIEILKNLFQPYKDFVSPYDYHDPRITSVVTSTCCKQRFEFHAGVTRYFFWQAYSIGDEELLGQQNFFNHFLDKRFQLCNCDAYKKALKENNTKELYKFYPLENFIFGSNAHNGPFTGINEFNMHLGETTVMADDARQCLYSFNNGKLDGQFYSYQYYDFGIDSMGLWDFDDYIFENVEEKIFHMIDEFIINADPDDEVKPPLDIKNNYLSLIKKYIAEKKHPAMYEYEGEFPLFLSNYSKELWQKYLKNYKNYGSHVDFFEKIDPLTIVTETGHYKDNFKDGIFTNLNLDTNVVTYSTYKMGVLVKTETDTAKFSAPFTRNGIKI